MSTHTRDPKVRPAPAGLILAGGHSRRMGRPKAWLDVGGRPMLSVVAEAVAGGLARAVTQQGGAALPNSGAAGQRGGTRASPPLVIVGAAGQELPEIPGATVVRDEVPDEGPLRGMAAGLAALEGRAGAAFVSSCDVPLLRPALVARLFALLGDADIVVPEVEGRHHPLAAVYRVGVLATVRELLAAGRKRPFFLFERVRTRVVGAAELEPADPDLRSLRNLNTPEDLAAVVAGGPEQAP